MKARYLVLLLTLIAVPQLIAQPYCTSGNGSIPLGGVCGFIKKYTPSGWVEPSTSYTVQICTLDAKGKRTWCGNYNTFHSCDFLGQNCGAEFYAAGIAAPNTQVALYSWNDAEFYGNTSPALLTGTLPPSTCSADCGVYVPLYNPLPLYPRPLPSSAVVPYDGQQDTGLTFNMKWTPGRDANRNGLTIIYDLYAHGYGASDVLVASNLPCNPDTSGNCQFAVTAGLIPNAYMYWHVIGKIYYGPPIAAYYGALGYEASFTTFSNNWNTPVGFGADDWAHYLTGVSCGGSSMLATAVAIGTCEQFKIHKVDGTTGDLHDGDPVNLTLGSWYASAEQGGNDFVNINRTAAQSWETFTIVKLYTYSTPGTRIMSGDRVAFMTSDHIHYVEAANNGGGGVDTYATSPGSTSTFILHD